MLIPIKDVKLGQTFRFPNSGNTHTAKRDAIALKHKRCRLKPGCTCMNGMVTVVTLGDNYVMGHALTEVEVL